MGIRNSGEEMEDVQKRIKSMTSLAMKSMELWTSVLQLWTNESKQAESFYSTHTTLTMFSRPTFNAVRGGLALRTGGTRRCISSLGQAKTRPQTNLHARTHGQWQQCRGKASATRGAKELWAAHPYLVSLATAAIFAGAAGIAYANYLYSTYIIASFHKYPEPVAQKLRRAIYYTNIDLDPKNALKYYKQGLEIANDLGMDPFSNEIIGVKIQVSALMEKIQNYPKAIQVLEILRNDCLAWEDKFGQL